MTANRTYMGGRWYAITVLQGDLRHVTVDRYHRPSDAVFGALRASGVDKARSAAPITVECELLPPKPPKVSLAGYTRALRAKHGATVNIPTLP
jgi:hypothetical protein